MMEGTFENPFDDIYELLQAHEVKSPVFNRPFEESFFGMLFHHDDKFQPIVGTDGMTRLFPNRQMMDLYRGQTKPYPTCYPSLYRQEKGSIAQLIDRIKTAEFEFVLEEHPAVQELEEDTVFIDYVGLAQHYGLKTDVLDLTSDIRVAAFFACCPYDANTEKHHADVEDGSIGVLYRTMQLALLDFDNLSKFEVIGLQPFRRPAQQKGYAYQLEAEEDFLKKCASIHFKHSKTASKSLFKEFNEGDSLYPFDPIAGIVSKINSAKCFSRRAFRTAVERGGKTFVEPLSVYEERLKKLGILLMEESPHRLTDNEKMEMKQQWDEEGKESFYSQILPPRLTFLG